MLGTHQARVDNSVRCDHSAPPLDVEKKFKAVFLILLASVLNAQEFHEDIALPSFSGLDPDELKAFLADWKEEKNGEKLLSLTKKHDQTDWHLAIEHSPRWNEAQGCWDIKRTWVRLPKGNYQGLIPVGQHKSLPVSEIKILYFGKQSTGIRIDEHTTRSDYFALANAIKEEEKIELRSGSVTGKHLAKMISYIEKSENGDFWIEFHKPYTGDTLICQLKSTGLEYRVEAAGIQ